jgi:dTDP-4-dehydrorhamnose reductase
VNTVGIVKQRPEAADIRACIEVNALFPHRLEVLCELAKSRLIHISTDCVYSGAQGMYREEMPADPKDVYGSTKWLGEVADHAITLRTSIIGVELERRSGLVEWALRAGDPVPGYTRAIYSGLTTAALADVIKQVIDEPRLTGLYHVSSEPISKYDLLRELFAQIGVEKRVIADNTFVCDRSLDSTRFRQTTGWTPPSWPSMLRNLAQEIRERGDE